ncbi:conserved protein of unknown function （contain Sensor protein CheY-like domain&|uniref:response regulator n=1 Tax=Magnetospirillum sp. XM-1 TaxID=1663591 RepID=UPI00073DC532|nr:response regulator [Magnetospirillum sp. XM-1]CUW37728.1 conserved protein of unknown function \
MTMLLYLALVTGLTVSLYGDLDTISLLGWWAAVAIIVGTSLWQQRRYAADPGRADRAAYWMRRFIALSAANGVVLGLGALLFFDPRLGVDALVPLVFVVVFSIAASHAKMAIPLCAYFTFLPSLALSMVAVAPRAGAGSGFLLVFLIALVIFGIGFTRSSHRALDRMLRLGLANADLMEELRRARDQAESASEAKSAFLAVVSHEVRTPLNAMMGMTELLTEAPLEEAHRRRLDTLRAAGDHILGLIEDMLDFSRIEAGRVQLASKPFHIGALATETVDLLGEQAYRKGLSLRVEIEDGGWPYRQGDSRRLRQILVNLLHNAIKYTEAGTIRLCVDACRDAVVRCSIEDQGAGIPPDRREAVFEPFLRGESASARHEGAGLGLAISRRLVALMGGSLWLEPLEQGTRFCFTTILPAVVAPDTADEPAPQPLTCRGRVLVADDNPFGRDMVAAMMTAPGLFLDLADNGTQAVTQAAQNRYDLILLDQRMPGLDGSQALAAIRQGEARHGLPPVPVVAMTAGMPGKVRADFIAEGFADYLAKPFSRAGLAELLARHLPGPIAPMPGHPPLAIADATIIAHCREDADKLAAAVTAANLEEAGHLAHRLKGIGMVFAMPAVARAAEAIESALAGSKNASAPQLACLDHALADEARRLSRDRRRPQAAGPVRVLLVDDHEMVRDGLRAVFGSQPDFEVVGEAADGLDCIRMVVRHHPDLVLIDLAMPRMNGAEAVPEIRKRVPGARVVILTGAASPALMRSAAEAGADALVRKDVSAEELLRTLRAVLAGRPPPALTPPPDDAALPPLTRRERQVLKLIVEGRRTRDIAGLLGLSERTVEKHRASLGHKLGTSTPAEMAALAIRHGLTAD